VQGADERIVEALSRGDLEAAPVAPEERALLELVTTVTRHAYRTTDEEVQRLRDLGWTDPQIAEAVYIAALFAFFNRVADAFGLEEPGYRQIQSEPQEAHEHKGG
jgi:alkylhydroperoxidase family enzyme